jgi:FkbM family methyltransferase
MVIPDKPLGGTELMYNELISRLDPKILDRYSIFNYISNADFNKKTIYWNQLSYDQDAVQFLKDEDLMNKIDYFVFVSHWQAEMFRKTFGIPGYKTWVIKNASLPIPEKNFSDLGEKIKVCYTSTPWRGLSVLLDAWEKIDTTNCELHIFSSTKIYGTDFHSTAGHRFTELFERAKNMPNVVYRDYTPNEELRKELSTFDILAYPCVFEETSCISVIEALTAGLKVVCSNIGALPETTEGWADMYTIKPDANYHSTYFASLLDNNIKSVRSEESTQRLQVQSDLFRRRWSWDTRANDWASFFNQIIFMEEATVANQPNTEPTNYSLPSIQIPTLTESDTVIDIGAFDGSFTKEALDAGAGKVLAFEPSQEGFDVISLELKDSTKVSLYSDAVWSKDDLIISFKNDGANSTAFTTDSSFKVKTISLDTILKDIEEVRLLKITAQGAEYPILLTCTQLHKVKEIAADVHIITDETTLQSPLSWKGREMFPRMIEEYLKQSSFDVQLEITETPTVLRLKAINLAATN